MLARDPKKLAEERQEDLEKKGEEEYWDFLRKKYRKSQEESEYKIIDLGNGNEAELKTPAIEAYFEKCLKAEQKEVKDEIKGASYDTGISIRDDIKPTQPGLLGMSNAETIEEVVFPFTPPGREEINIRELYAKAGITGEKFKLLKITKNNQSHYVLHTHLNSGDDKKRDRKNEVNFIQRLVNALGVEVILGGDFQESPYNQYNEEKKQDELQHENGRLKFSEDFRNWLDAEGGLGELEIVDAAFQMHVYLKQRGLFSEGCEVILNPMPENNEFKPTEKNKLYLYQNSDNQIFYRLPGNDQPQILNQADLPPSLLEEKFNEPHAFSDENGCAAILKITSALNHTNDVKKFIGPCFAVNEQGEKNGLKNYSAGMMAFVVRPRTKSVKDGGPKNSDILNNKTPPKLEIIDVNNNTEITSDHDTVTIKTKDVTAFFAGELSQAGAKRFKDAEEYYKKSAFIIINGVLCLDPEVRKKENIYSEKFYKIAVPKMASLILTNPDDCPYPEAKDEKRLKTNAHFLAEFRAELTALGINPGQDGVYTEADMNGFDFTDVNKCTRLHKAVDAFLSTQARGNENKKPEEKADPFPDDPRSLPPGSSNSTRNPALTKVFYEITKEFLLSQEFNEGYYPYVKEEKQKHREMFSGDNERIHNYLCYLIGEFNRKSRGGSGRSPANFFAEIVCGLQNKGGFDKLFGRVAISPECLDSMQAFAEMETLCRAHLCDKTLPEDEMKNKIVYEGVTEASNKEHPYENDPEAADAFGRHNKIAQACFKHHAMLMGLTRDRLHDKASAKSLSQTGMHSTKVDTQVSLSTAPSQQRVASP